MLLQRKTESRCSLFPEGFSTGTPLYCLMYWIQSCVPKIAFIKCEKSVSLYHSTELTGQVACLMEKEQESSYLKSTGENELASAGLRLI